MDICLLTPFGYRTGGPEATLQLSDALIADGWPGAVYSVHYDTQQIRELERLARKSPSAHAGYAFGERRNPFPEYDHYKINVRDVAPDDENTVIVFPETILDVAPAFKRSAKLIWWLSVDNAFNALSRCNLNHLRHASAFHATQSAYAKHFIQPLGLNDVGMLSDYTSGMFETAAPTARDPALVALSARPKVVSDLGALENKVRALIPEAQFERIQKKTRAEVLDILGRAKVFVDLGCFPGKDRLAREASLLGCAVILGRAGAGAFEADYAIPEADRIDAWDLDAIAERIAAHVQSEQERQRNVERLRPTILRERDTFRAEAQAVFRAIEAQRKPTAAPAEGEVFTLVPSTSWRAKLPKPLRRLGMG